MNDWKAEMTSKVLSERYPVRITGITKLRRHEYEYIQLVIGLFIGAFIAIMVLRPDLIDWNTFGRSFTTGIIIGARH